MLRTKADFIYEPVDGVLCIEDLDIGGMSVTNDMENVLEHIRNELKQISFPFPPVVIYRDSEGVWDGVEFVKDKLRFYPLQERSRKKAISKAKERWINQ